jgi:hypothetical protein
MAWWSCNQWVELHKKQLVHAWFKSRCLCLMASLWKSPIAAFQFSHPAQSSPKLQTFWDNWPPSSHVPLRKQHGYAYDFRGHPVIGTGVPKAMSGSEGAIPATEMCLAAFGWWGFKWNLVVLWKVSYAKWCISGEPRWKDVLLKHTHERLISQSRHRWRKVLL